MKKRKMFQFGSVALISIGIYVLFIGGVMPNGYAAGRCYECQLQGEYWSCMPVQHDAGATCNVDEVHCTMTGACHYAI